MTTIYAVTADQILTATIIPKIASGNQNTVRLQVKFDSAWDGYAKSAVFYTSEDPTRYETVLSSDNICYVPPETLAEKGYLIITVKGVSNSGRKKSSTELKCKILPGTPYIAISDPSDDVYKQLLSAYSDTKETLAESYNNLKKTIYTEANAIKKSNAADKAETENAIAVERARINSFVALANVNTTEGAELQDVRIGANGITYPTAGDAVRGQISALTDDLKAFQSVSNAELELGTLSGGEAGDTTTRARFTERIWAHRAVVTIAENTSYLFGYTIYDENGIYNGVDYGWNSMDGRRLTFENCYFRMNFLRTDGGEITADDLSAISSSVTITQFSTLNDIKELKETVHYGAESVLLYELEVGSLNNGEKVDMANRARFAEKVKITAKSKAVFNETSIYQYGYAVYDENGVYDGIDRGWNRPNISPVVEFSSDGYVSFNFIRNDNETFTSEDIETIYSLLTITDRTNIFDLSNELKKSNEKSAYNEIVNAAIASINIEYGRISGASYVLARIPKMTNDGNPIVPSVHLTSDNESIDGAKKSALAYARKHKPIFVCNAGLFDMTAMIPLGQTIIDGKVLVSDPMTDDNGSAISDFECYPLCIDANGNLSAPYTRSITTAEMLADGVVHSVTGWGKIIENFVSCPDTVENEIVHAGKYIRQVIGQYQTGDYFVCSVDMSRNTIENEAGITYADLADFLISKGVKFAYSLDGGGSCETVIGVRQINPIYEGTAGRPVPTVISFDLV